MSKHSNSVEEFTQKYKRFHYNQSLCRFYYRNFNGIVLDFVCSNQNYFYDNKQQTGGSFKRPDPDK